MENKILLPKFIQQQFEQYMQINSDDLPFKKQSTKKQFVQTFNMFYCNLYQKIVVDSNNSPTNISIQTFKKITNSNEKIYFILNFFKNKNYIIPIVNKKGNKHYCIGKKGASYKFTDQFLNKVENSQGVIDQEANRFVLQINEQYKAQVESESDKLLKDVFNNQKRINEVKHCMNNLKQLRFVCDQTSDQINLTKKWYKNNIVKFNYRIYSPFSSTNKQYIKMGCVVDQNNNSINELYDWHASGIQMLEFIMKSKIKDCKAELEWIESMFDQGNFYTAVANSLGWNYNLKYNKNMVQWFINSNPAFKQEFLKNGVCREKNVNENAIMGLFNKNTPKLFKFLAEYETYNDHGIIKSGIWKLIHKTETLINSYLVPKIELRFNTKIYTKHDSFNCNKKYCTEENRLVVKAICDNFKREQIFGKKEVKQHEVFNEEDHITIDKLFDYYENYYCMGRVVAPILKDQTQILWRQFNLKVFKPVWNNVDCGNILQGRRLQGENWQSRRDQAKEIINNAIHKAIRCLQKIQTKFGNQVYKDIILTMFQTQKDIIFYGKDEI